MNIVEARDQNGLDTILKRTDVEDICIRVYFDAYISTNKNIFIVSRGSSAPHIESRESSAPRIESRESSAPRIESRESSAPHIVSRESSAPRIESWESSAPHIVSRESSAPRIVSWGSSAPHIVSRESSAPHIESRESSAPHIVSWESSAPRIVSWESSAPHIESRESSAPHIESRGSCTVILDGKNIIAKASKHNVVHLFNGALCKGGIQIKVPIIDSAEKWLEHYGVKPIRGVAVLYKAVDEDFSTNYARAAGIFYIPGEIPVAPDWDGGQEECGGGLHLCAHPGVAKTFNDEAKHFIACPVKVSDIVVHYPAKYPEKIKVPKIFRAVYEVNEDGEKL